MAFTRDDLAAYEQQPAATVDDSANPFDASGAAKAPAKTPAATEQTQTDDSSSSETDSDPADSGDGTSDATSDSSTETADLDSDAETTEGEGEQPTGEPADEERNPPKKGSARERIQELADERDGYREFGKLASERLKALEAENARLRGEKPATEPKPAPVQEKPKLGPMPKLSDPEINFDPDVLAEKQADWMEKKIAEGVSKSLEERTGRQTIEQTQNAFLGRIEEFKSTHKDWDVKVRNPALPELQPVTQTVIARSDFGPAILYHLASDIGLAQRIAKLSPEDQVMRIGEIKAQIESKAPSAAKPAAKQPVPEAKPGQKKSVSNAPPPPTPTPAGKRSTEREVTDSGLDMEEFARRHRESKNQARATARKMRGLN